MYGTRWCFHRSDIRSVWHSKNSILRMSWNTSFGYVSKCVALEFNVFLLSQYSFFLARVVITSYPHHPPNDDGHPNNRWCIDSRHQHPCSGLNGSSKKSTAVFVEFVLCLGKRETSRAIPHPSHEWEAMDPSNNDWRIEMFKGCLGFLGWVDFQQDYKLCNNGF